MTNTEIIEFIKTILKSKAEKQGSVITYDFFENIRAEVLDAIKILSAVREKDDQTIQQYYATAVNEFLSVFPIDIDPSSSLRKKDLKTWLTEERKESMPIDYIGRYITYQRKEGRSEKVLEEISKSSEKILGCLVDPKSESAFYIKGLVVGSIQSGKTGNFNAVINRAIDAGYSLIIVLSGIMEDLRSQTQDRIDKDIVGEGIINFLTGSLGDKGVGKIRKFGEQGDQSVRQIFSITSCKSDFKRSLLDANFSLNNKNLLVCKKNTGVLKNLLVWLHDYLNENKEQHSIPLLIIDDEADNASLNNLGHLGREYANAINGHIRAILGLFSKKAYLGYTATPFANVLQDRNETPVGKWRISYNLNGEPTIKEFAQVDNIFPDDFIELLTSPSNYIGAKQIFETVLDTEIKKIPLLEAITDCFQTFPYKVIDDNGITRPATQVEIEDSKTKTRSGRKDDNFPIELPNSLLEAVQCYILSIALRLSRKPGMINSKLYNPHHSMLIHVSRFITWQTKTKQLVSNYVSSLESEILNDLPTAQNSVYNRLEKIWNKYYAAIVANIRSYLSEGYQDEFLISKTYNQIKPLLIEAIKGIEVKALNSETKDKLVYAEDPSRNGKKYIAVGGNKLSRGFTLEGLTINYFIRDTNFSDTLLQMGRWFGYRPGYLDCCKLFTTYDAIEKFNSTTRTIEELEFEFRKMERQNKTPEDFIIRVRKDPGVLKITRPSILKNAEEVNWSYQDKLIQTSEFKLNGLKLTKSWNDFKSLIEKNKGKVISRKDDFFLIQTDYCGLFEFLDANNTFYNFQEEILSIKKFIELCVAKNKLKNWTIAIKRKGQGEIIKTTFSGLPGEVQMTIRNGPTEGVYKKQLIQNCVFTGSGKSANIVTSGRDFSILLSKPQIDNAEETFIKERIEFYINKKKYDKVSAEAKAKKINRPERIYRERMSSEDGLLVIYLIDTKKIFRPDGVEYNEMEEIILREVIDINIPLIGYAIGFPPISPDPGGVYMKGKYDIKEDEEEVEEFDEGLNAED